MVQSKNINNPNLDSKENRILAKNTFYSYLTSYGGMIFPLLISFMLARLISIEDWGFLILATSIITLFAVISMYFPPAIDYSLQYYLSLFIASNQPNKIKTFIKRAVIVKLLFLIPIFIISLIIFQIFSGFFTTIFGEKINILYILSPLIIIIGFESLLYGINKSLDMFHTYFFLSLISYCFQIAVYILITLLTKNVSLELIALINLFTHFIRFSLNCIFILKKMFNIKGVKTREESFREFNTKILKYGFPLSFGYLIYGFWSQLQILGVSLLNAPEFITGYNLSLKYSSLSILILSSLSAPLIISFSRLISSNKEVQISLIYKISVKFSLFMVLLISGMLYFFTDFFLFAFYGESYLIFSTLVKLMAISTIFRIIATPFEALILAKNKVNLLIPIKIISFIIYLSFFFSGLFFYGILGAIFSILISNLLLLMFYIFLSFKISNIRINLKKIFLQYLSFIISLIITQVLENHIFQNLTFLIGESLNLNFLKFFHIFSILTFIIVYIILNTIFKVFSEEDFENMDIFIKKQSKFYKIIHKCLKLF